MMIFQELHATQIITIQTIFGFQYPKDADRYSTLVQILTGEGKSLILGILSTIYALLGFNVDVVCYSNYLSKRDEKAFEFLFKALEVEDKIHYGTFT